MEKRYIHEHELFKIMLDTGRVFTREELKTLIVDQFGPEALFYNCRASGLTPEALITQMERDGNFLLVSESLMNLMD